MLFSLLSLCQSVSVSAFHSGDDRASGAARQFFVGRFAGDEYQTGVFPPIPFPSFVFKSNTQNPNVCICIRI